MSVAFATQLTAVATLALALLALATAVLAFMAWGKQSREVRDQAEMLRVQSEQLAEARKVNAEQIRVLGLQAEEFRQAAADPERDLQERRRAQAAMVYMWTAPAHVAVDGVGSPEMTLEAYVRNTSPQPIYDVQFTWQIITADRRKIVGGTECEAPLMPLAMSSARAPRTPGVLVDRPYADAAVTFRDRAGVWWRTEPSGHLEELPPQPVAMPLFAADGSPTDDITPDAGKQAP
jgi:hypothetical protein